MANIRLDVNHMMKDFLGERGIDGAEMNALFASLSNAYKAVEAGRGKGMQGWMDLPYNQDEIRRGAHRGNRARAFASEFDAFVVLGIGGSALGPPAVQQALNHLRYNELPDGQARRARALRRGQHRSRAHGCAAGRGGPEQDVLQRHLQVRRHRRNHEPVPDRVSTLLKEACGERLQASTSSSPPRETKGFLIKIGAARGLQDVLHSRRRGRTLLRAVPRGPAGGGRLRASTFAALLAGAKEMDERCNSGDMIEEPRAVRGGV